MPSQASKSSALSRRLYSLRTSAKLSQVELAVLAKVAPTTVAGIEQGSRQGSPRTLKKLEAALAKALDLKRVDLSGSSTSRS